MCIYGSECNKSNQSPAWSLNWLDDQVLQGILEPYTQNFPSAPSIFHGLYLQPVQSPKNHFAEALGFL